MPARRKPLATHAYVRLWRKAVIRKISDVAQVPTTADLAHDERSGVTSSACEIYPYPRARSSSRSLSEFCGRARPAPLRPLYVAIAVMTHVAWNARPARRTN